MTDDDGERYTLPSVAILERPLSFSLEPPSVSLDIIRCSRPPERLLCDSSEIMLALRFGGCSSIGGPSSRKSIRSRAALEMCGFEGSRLEDGVCGIVSVSLSFIPITSSRSRLSRFLPGFRVRCGRPSGVDCSVGTEFCRFAGIAPADCKSGSGTGGRIQVCDGLFCSGCGADMVTDRARELDMGVGGRAEAFKLACRVRGVMRGFWIGLGGGLMGRETGSSSSVIESTSRA